MNFKDLYYFSGKCLALDSNPDFRETIITTITAGTFPVKMFVWLCDRHLILPALYIKFRDYNLLNFLPLELSSHLEYVYELNKKRNLEIIQQVEQINASLLFENISPVYLKGTGNLLDQIYSDPGERMIGDIDMLVKDSDYLKTIELVISLGYNYEKTELATNVLPKHFNRLYRRDVPADIEIHRAPVNFPFSRKFNTELIFAERIPAQGKEDCYVPSFEHRIIHNFIHAQLSNKGHWYKSNSLRDLYDIHILSKQADFISINNQVEEKNKFISYIAFANRIFNSTNHSFPLNKRSATYYRFLSDFFLEHGQLYRVNQIIYNVYELLFIKFPDRTRLAINDKLYREHTYSRIKSEGLFCFFKSIK
jgi:hypothetical protein